METVKISKREYDQLLDKAMRLDYLKNIMDYDFFSSPPTKKISKIMDEFKKTKKYNDKFLISLEKGLKRSKHFKNS